MHSYKPDRPFRNETKRSPTLLKLKHDRPSGSNDCIGAIAILSAALSNGLGLTECWRSAHSCRLDRCYGH
ncbi:MAG: hypothetical protein RBJ76_14505 [Stenomitos frigidus ULC029]